MAGFIITPPEQLGDKDLAGFFRGWDWRGRKAVGKQVTLDLQHCKFLAPWALTLFSLYLLKLREEHVQVDIAVSDYTPAGNYAATVGMYDLFGLKRPAGYKAPEDARTTPLSRIRTGSEIPSVSAAILGVLGIEDEEMSGAVEYSLIELLRNVVQHSQSSVGGMTMAQYYPTTGLVEIAVADVGIGIKATLSSQYERIDGDLEALKLALLPHVSGTFSHTGYGNMSENAGLGLFFIKEIVSRGYGGLFLASGEAMIDIWGKEDGEQGKLYVKSKKAGWPGSFAVLQFRRGGIVDFGSLLELCRDLAATSREKPGRIPLEFIDELPVGKNLRVVAVRDFAENVDTAATVRDADVIPRLKQGEQVILDFEGVRFATQSFAHACLYKVLRDVEDAYDHLSIARATDATRQAILAVAAYARQK